VKVINVNDLKIDACVRVAQGQEVVVTKNGQPVLLMLGVKGMDLEQLELCRSAKFWALMRERRTRPAISRKELEDQLAAAQRPNPKKDVAVTRKRRSKE